MPLMSIKELQGGPRTLMMKTYYQHKGLLSNLPVVTLLLTFSFELEDSHELSGWVEIPSVVAYAIQCIVELQLQI